MNNESFSDFEAKDTNFFEGKHHLIASLVLGTLFEDENDIRSAFNETIAE
jgi:hypothetical protein